jgi:3'-phosphoadenosine 5'-phosphosulfate (PAPS) 3'-phosphatase
MPDLERLLPVAREAVAIARRIIRYRGPLSVLAKGERDMVTDVDLAVEDAVREFLGRETPDVGILGEEQGQPAARTARCGGRSIRWTARRTWPGAFRCAPCRSAWSPAGAACWPPSTCRFSTSPTRRTGTGVRRG